MPKQYLAGVVPKQLRKMLSIMIKARAIHSKNVVRSNINLISAVDLSDGMLNMVWPSREKIKKTI